MVVMSIKLVSINIEGQKHLDTVGEFLAREDADIVCLMEVYDIDVVGFAGGDYPYLVYAPNNVVEEAKPGRPRITLGVATLSKQPILDSEILYCDHKTEETIEMLGMGTHSPVIVITQIGRYSIAAIHFTWTPKMSVTQRQTKDLERLLALLKGRELVMVGDFNIPRGNKTYQKLLTKYRDNVPTEVETTIDPKLHRVNQVQKGKLAVVVDYIWSTPKYRVSNVRTVEGVSDHCAILCEIDKLI